MATRQLYFTSPVCIYIYIERERTELIVYELKKLSLFYALKEKKTFENKMVGRQSALKNNKKKSIACFNL